jgi:hypothetical protein
MPCNLVKLKINIQYHITIQKKISSISKSSYHLCFNDLLATFVLLSRYPEPGQRASFHMQLCLIERLGSHSLTIIDYMYDEFEGDNEIVNRWLSGDSDPKHDSYNLETYRHINSDQSI